ncbi:MAG: aminotransferase class I/II-fold pyridoxal phosphate-dependent enzyme, partial [Propionibacteriaceae bacterium]|nr:aminotransferase class I/II-fold pyridoxal phosphate-dependent enzyme [Propionibacteriaceae bacterium]
MLADEHGGDRAAYPGVRLDFSTSVGPLGTPPAVAQAITAAIPAIDRYPDPACRGLRAALAAHHGLTASTIACGNGAADIIHRIAWALRPRRVLTFAPTFTEYAHSARAVDAEVIHQPLSPPYFDLTDATLAAVTDGIDLVFCCQPNNPTGRLTAADRLAQLVD